MQFLISFLRICLFEIIFTETLGFKLMLALVIGGVPVDGTMPNF